MNAQQLVEAVVASYDYLQEPLRSELMQSDALATVVSAWLTEDDTKAEEEVSLLVETLCRLRDGGPDVVTQAKAQEQRRSDWREKKQQAIQKIREAADLLQCNRPVDLRQEQGIRQFKGRRKELGLDVLALSGRPVTAEETSQFLKLDLKDPNNLQWLASMGHLDVVLRGIAEALASVNVGPLMTRPKPKIPKKHIGTRGGAAEPSSAFNGVVVREIHSRLPESLQDDYALIKSLADHTGVDISRPNVRSILKRGRT